MGAYGFELGRLYNRQRDIHGRFGGQQQGGIATPTSVPVVFAFTGPVGRTHGYNDYWTDDGVFCFYGEGQRGDMAFQRGNAAIRDHITKGEDLLLFEKEPSQGVRFKGQFICESWHARPAPDADGAQRQAIVFHLVPADRAHDHDSESTAAPRSLDQLRRAAYRAGTEAPNRRETDTRSSFVERSAAVRSYVLTRANGVCEGCLQPAPFMRPNGLPFLEVHHLHRLSDGGPDHPARVSAICPNCHRRVHFGHQGNEFNHIISARIAAIEDDPDRRGAG